MTMPHLMNCPHKGGTWCLKCVGEEWDRREAERDALNARIAELERKAKAFDTIADRSVTIQPQPASWCVWHVPGAPVFTQTLLEAVETAIEAAIAAKETK